MNSLNSILVEGNLVKDPATKTLPSGNQVCAFTLATNRYYKAGEQGMEEEVSYFDVEAWSRLGTTCAQYLKKGRGVRVVGRLKAKVKIVAEHVEFSPKKQSGKGGGPLQAEGQTEVEASAEAVVF
ncbi:MAG: single-stranded DNA-binding protein [Spirochaetes bacterium]|nr:single-stranded DNA-binding protein [Spirochaetota bacterium]